jgi:hypothetical protein
MMNFKSFQKEDLLKLLKTVGFESVEDDAFLRIVITVEVMIYNILNNVRHISDSLKLTTIKKSHLEAVMKILNQKSISLKEQKGGHAGTVLPSEYFGHDSGRYFDYSKVSPFEQSVYVDNVARGAVEQQQGGHAGTVLPSEYFGHDSGRYFDYTKVYPHEQSVYSDDLARSAVQYQYGGAKTHVDNFINKVQVKFLIDEYKTAKNASFKVSSAAYDIIMYCLKTNVMKLLENAKKQTKSKTLTLKTLVGTISKHFPYMEYSFKQ